MEVWSISNVVLISVYSKVIQYTHTYIFSYSFPHSLSWDAENGFLCYV